MTTLEELDARVRALEDVQAITRLKHRYFRLLDQQVWDELGAISSDPPVSSSSPVSSQETDDADRTIKRIFGR